jgi:hypothetical protein
MPTKTIKLEIVELEPANRERLKVASRTMRELQNFVWRQWEAWHTAANSADELRAMFAANEAWQQADKADRGERPKWTVQPWPNDFGKHVYQLVTRRFPRLHVRTIDLALQKIRKTVCTKNSSSRGGLKWWIAILLDLDGRATFHHAQPVPFDSKNCKVLESDTKGRVRLSIRMDRVEREGKRGTSEPIECHLKTGGKRAYYALPAHQIAAGTRKLKGSQVVFDDRSGKLFACLTYEAAAKSIECDPNKTAVVRAGRKHCWLVRIGGYTRRMGGRGNHVAHKRKSLLSQRWGRQSSYRHAPARKGSGRQRALSPLFKLSNAWNAFTRRCNDKLTHDVVELCEELGVGRVVYIHGDETRLLATAGKIGGRNDSSEWPWFQVEQLLEQKCNRLGIETKVRSKKREAKSAQRAKSKAVALKRLKETKN